MCGRMFGGVMEALFICIEQVLRQVEIAWIIDDEIYYITWEVSMRIEK